MPEVTLIYPKSHPAVRHQCALGALWAYDTGTLRKCNKCGKWSRLGFHWLFTSRQWNRVRWFNFISKARIRKATR